MDNIATGGDTEWKDKNAVQNYALQLLDLLTLILKGNAANASKKKYT